MGVEVDKLIFALDGDLTPYAAKLAQAESMTKAAAARIQASNNSLLGNPVNIAASAVALNAWAKASGYAAGETEKVATSAHGATREIRALATEVGRGEFTRIPITLALMASHLGTITLGAVATTVAILAVPAAFVAATISAQNMQANITRSLQATGYAAGATTDKILQMAGALSSTGSMSFRGASDALSGLARSGNIPGSLLPGIAALVPGYSNITGKNQTDSTGALAKIFSDLPAGSKELADNFKALSAAQQKEISDAIAIGDSLKAQKVMLEGAKDRFSEATDKITWLGKAADSAGNFLSGLYSWLGGSQNLSSSAQIALLRRQMADKSPADQARIQAQIYSLEAGAAGAEGKAAYGFASGQMNTSVAGASSTATQYDTAANKIRTYTDESVKLAGGLANAKIQYMALQAQLAVQPDNAGLRDQASALKEIINQIERVSPGVAIAAKNQRTPAQIAAQAAANAMTVFQTKPQNRALVSKMLSVQENYRNNLSNPETATDAGSIRMSQSAQATTEDWQATMEETTKSGNAALSTLAAQLEQNFQDGVDAQKKAQDTSEAAAREYLANLVQSANAAFQQTQQMWVGVGQQLSGALTNAFDAAVFSGGKLSDVVKGLGVDIGRLILQLTVLNPLENSIVQAVSGKPGGSELPTAGLSNIFSGISNFLGFSNGGAWSGGVRFAGAGMVLPGPTMFSTAGGPVIGGELGKDSEALMPLSRGPDGRLGVRSHGGGRSGPAVNITQVISIHPDVSATARAEVLKMMPLIQSAAVQGVRQVAART